MTHEDPTIYNVYVYREMRLLFTGVSAASHEEAAKLAAGKVTSDAESIEDCDGEDISALVDVVGDTEYEKSKFIDFRKAGAA